MSEAILPVSSQKSDTQDIKHLPVDRSGAVKGGAAQKQAPDPLLLAYLAIAETVQISSETAQTGAKQLEANSNEQENYINFEAGIQFSLITNTKAKTSVLQKIETDNQAVQARLNLMNNQMSVLKQNAQVQETTINTNTNAAQQSISEGSKVSQIMVTLNGQVSRI